jgi:nucleoid-associated protein YgaU
MIGSKLIAMIAAVVGVVGVSAAGVYLYRQSQEAPPSVQDQVATGTARAPAAEQPKPQALVSPNPHAEPKGAAVPSFDVVRIEPTGEGVIAGRAEPGWQVSVESHGSKVAEATADAEGEWTIVLDKPLPPGDHALSLKAVSPDGTHGLVSQTEVPIAIAKKPGEGTAVAMSEPVVPAPEAGDTTEALPNNEAGEKSKPEAGGPKLRGDIGQVDQAKPETRADATPSQSSAQTPSAAPEPAPSAKTAEEGGEPTPASPTEQAQEEPSAKPKQPQVMFKTVDYEDKGDQPGKVVLTGTGDPGARILLFFDDGPLGQVIIGGDGTWRFEIVKLLPFGRHAFRAGRVDETTGLVGGSASIGVQRMEPAPKVAEPETAPSSPAAPSSQAAAPEAARPSSEAKPSPGPSSQATSSQVAPPQVASPQVAAAETGKPPAAEAARPVRHKEHKPGVYTVRRGDSLWAIAERFFGGGWHYVTIYHQNRKHIRNPRLIYPQQKVHLPKP